MSLSLSLSDADDMGAGGCSLMEWTRLDATGRKAQRLAQRALLTEGFNVPEDIQRDLVKAMSQIVLSDAYDARRRTQAANTLVKFQRLRLAELESAKSWSCDNKLFAWLRSEVW